MGTLGSAARAQESEMSQKPQVWAKRWSLTTHQPALLCSTQVQKNSVCSFPHRTGCSSLFNLLLPSPWFFAAPFHQHYPNSPNPGLSICGISEQLRRTETLGTCCSSVLRSPCTRTSEFLMKDGELSFSQHRSRWTSLTQALKSWLLYFSTFFFFIFFFFLQKLFHLPDNSYMCRSSQKLSFFSWLNQGAEMLPCDLPCSVETNPFASSKDCTQLQHLT